MINRTRYEFDVKITNILNKDAVVELLKLFRTMEYFGSIGSSRTIKVNIDGDGAFNPKFKFNTSKLQEFYDKIEPISPDKKEDDMWISLD